MVIDSSVQLYKVVDYLFFQRNLNPNDLFILLLLYRNVIIHVVTAWLSTRLLLSLAGILFPTIANVCLIFVNIAICLVQDIKLGVSIIYLLL
jgi:Mg2+/Co2+ transporter CorB